MYIKLRKESWIVSKNPVYCSVPLGGSEQILRLGHNANKLTFI